MQANHKRATSGRGYFHLLNVALTSHAQQRSEQLPKLGTIIIAQSEPCRFGGVVGYEQRLQGVEDVIVLAAPFGRVQAQQPGFGAGDKFTDQALNQPAFRRFRGREKCGFNGALDWSGTCRENIWPHERVGRGKQGEVRTVGLPHRLIGSEGACQVGGGGFGKRLFEQLGLVTGGLKTTLILLATPLGQSYDRHFEMAGRTPAGSSPGQRD